MPRVLLLGGLDPSGGAGITADATVIALHHAQALPIAIAFTEQNRLAFRRCYPVPSEQWCRALHAVLEEGEVHAVKVGLIADTLTLRTVARELTALRGQVPIVVDPVLSATAGGLIANSDLAAAYLELLVPITTVFTPNVPELAAVCEGDAKRALAAGAEAVLAKGGHAEGVHCEDVLWQGDERLAFVRSRQHVGPVRGTGCALASAIAARMAHGAGIAQACRRGGDWLAALLRVLGSASQDGLPRSLPFGRALPVLDAPLA